VTTITPPPSGPGGRPEPARRVESAAGGVDRVFGLSLASAGVTVLLIMGTVGLFLFVRGSSALADAGLRFLTRQGWTQTHTTSGSQR
jgi:phosphate transport system permease protein